MPMKFLMATLVSGLKVVSGFDNLGGSGQGYATQVFAQVKPFNAWRKIGSVHPHSGETVNIRSREMLSGAQIVKIQQVKPKAGFEGSHEYEPENFEPVAEIQHGRYGVFVVDASAPFGEAAIASGAVAGAEYPIHREDSTFRRYVILKVATAETPEVRFWIDDAPSTESGSGVGAGIDDDDDDEVENRQVRRRGPADADEDLGED
jgi:hypothetical protein